MTGVSVPSPIRLQFCTRWVLPASCRNRLSMPNGPSLRRWALIPYGRIRGIHFTSQLIIFWIERSTMGWLIVAGLCPGTNTATFPFP